MGSSFCFFAKVARGFMRENYLDWKRPSRNKYQMRSRFKPCGSLLVFIHTKKGRDPHDGITQD